MGMHTKVLISGLPCSQVSFGEGNIVCRCNATYCDTVDPLEPLAMGSFAQYTSTRDGKRLYKTVGSISQSPTGIVIRVDKNTTFQRLFGFGGAFTDAAAINIANLSTTAANHVIDSYYGPMGIEYSVGRVPIGSCDFSTHPYSYDDTDGDFNLTKFQLAEEDITLKIPLIQRAISVSKRNISFFGSPWTAPAWMKTNNNLTGKGSIKGEAGNAYHKTWALHFVKFLDAYLQYNISFWGLTAQNEPTDGNIDHFPFQATGWTPEQQRDFISKDLGPALHANGYTDLKLMMLDDQRLLLTYWADTILADPGASKYISGVAVHWYMDAISPTFELDYIHKKYSDHFIFGTEACYDTVLHPVNLGNWKHAEGYAHDIMQDLEHWVTGWTDWNLALNLEGGPNWVHNYVDSPVIVNAEQDEFYKQPMFYAMGHFSKFLPSGSIRIGNIAQGQVPEGIKILTFQTPSGYIVTIILNV
ncbi:lysosomal acid glucosylceramidase-like [Saccostrea echinata]|uniref:lysosomal acid glucosylceramidase-like n=1 Tax=Saccostrea echinata TaxID=191078 RepID=UPI002A7EBAC6|nr:lysosomal acid glucosylceramidase-like [Saccostrea echinata]